MKQKILRITNILLALLILNQILSGFFGKEIGNPLFELLHKRGAILLVIVIVAHLILNWGWIKNSYFKKG